MASDAELVLCKLQRLIAVEQLRKTLDAEVNALDFLHTIDTDTLTLIDLAFPTIGTHTSRIIGALLLMKLWNAVLARKERDKRHHVVVDEASLFQMNPKPRMLAESRKFDISMVLSHQHTGQLSACCRGMPQMPRSSSAIRIRIIWKQITKFDLPLKARQRKRAPSRCRCLLETNWEIKLYLTLA